MLILKYTAIWATHLPMQLKVAGDLAIELLTMNRADRLLKTKQSKTYNFMHSKPRDTPAGLNTRKCTEPKN